MKGIFSLMLHAHIPYCRKSGVWPAGEEWLFEAMNETYIPLLRILREFQQKNLKPHIMVGIVPILAEQLADPYMNDRFCEYMEDKIRRAERDLAKYVSDTPRRVVANYYRSLFIDTYDAYKNHFFRNLMGSFKWLQDEGIIEVLTSAATHGFLPLLERDSAVYSQIHLGVQTYEKYFHRKPRGIWLPECAYRWRERDHQENRDRKSLDEWLADEGIQYFFVEDVGINSAEIIENKHNESKPTTYRGYKTESGVVVFGRNNATGKQVWSPHEGYPGHSDYREFHQKDPDSGLHYWRITGENAKRIYDPQAAQDVISSQALHFQNLLMSKVQEQGSSISEHPPFLVSPYDCELYGHWWHEGVQWINQLFQGLLNQADISPLNLEEVVKRYGDSFSTIRMKPSTWGENSDFTVWKNNDHCWIWPYINGCSKDLEQVLATIKNSGRELNQRDHRILRQLGRELVLMEGSDWPFLLYTQQAKEYANQRFHNHHQRFNKLLWAAKNLEEPFRISENDLRSFEDIDNPWQDLQVNLFNKK